MGIKKQPIIAQSIEEVEYIAACQAIWFKEDFDIIEWKEKIWNHNLLWQHLVNCIVHESSLPREKKACKDQISIF